MSEHRLDARYILCPLPVIRTQQTVEALHAGDLLTVVCTDPGALHDIPAWCRIHGHEVIDTQHSDDQVTVRLRVCQSGDNGDNC